MTDTKDTRTEFELLLEHYKVDNQVTDKEIAEAIKCSTQSLSYKRRGLAPIDVYEAKAFADMLGMTLDELYPHLPMRT